MIFHGIYTPLVTPFRPDYSVHDDELRHLVDSLLEARVHGLIVAGTTGEYYAQSINERIELMHAVIEYVDRRCPVIVGTGALRTQESVELASAATQAGADALLIATPPYSQPTSKENALHALSILENTDLPAMLYNYPGRMAAEMDEEFLDRVGQSSQIKAIKESSGDINRIHLLARQYPHIQLSCGMDDQALEFFAWGAKSWVCAASNFIPEAHIALWRACVIEGDFIKGRKIMMAMLPLLQILEQGGQFIQSIKHGLTLNGIDAGPPRRPLRPLNSSEKRQLTESIERLQKTLACLQKDQL